MNIVTAISRQMCAEGQDNGHPQIAALVGVKEPNVYRWEARGAFPPRHIRKIVNWAQENDFLVDGEELSHDLLLRLVEDSSSPSRQNTAKYRSSQKGKAQAREGVA